MHAHAKPLKKRRDDGPARREALVGSARPLGAGEERLVDDRGNRQFDPLLLRALPSPGQALDGALLLPASAVAPGRLARIRRLQVSRLADTGLVLQDDAQGRERPVPGVTRPHALCVKQGAGLAHLQPLVHMESEYPSHRAGLGRIDFKARAAGLALADQAVPVGRQRDHVQRTLPGAVDPAPTTALRDLRALVFGNHRQYLAQQHAGGRGIVRFLDADDRCAAAAELFLQQDLMGKVPAQPVDRPDQHGPDFAARDAVAQRFERRTLERRATEPVIGKLAAVRNFPAAAAAVIQNGLPLAADRLALALCLARHPQMHRQRRIAHRIRLHRPLLSLWTSCVRAPMHRRPRKHVLRRNGRTHSASGRGAFSRTTCPTSRPPPRQPGSRGRARWRAHATAAGRATGAGCAR